MKLPMTLFLTEVMIHGVNAKTELMTAGYHPAVIWRKAEKAARKGYTEYGVTADMCWLTDKGARKIGM